MTREASKEEAKGQTEKKSGVQSEIKGRKRTSGKNGNEAKKGTKAGTRGDTLTHK